MPLLIPDPNRKTPDSIDRASDLCGKWRLWGRGDHIDSVICCKMFPTRHKLKDSDIARALSILHKECANMKGKDVVELYRFLEANPDLHTNGIRLWQGIEDRARKEEEEKKEKEKDDDIKIALAIGRFSSNSPTGRFRSKS